MKIIPSIGRRVWYWPSAFDLGTRGMVCNDSRQPFDAGVIYVWNESGVNLMVTDHIGKTFPLSSVSLFAADTDLPKGLGVAQWMPYQAAQAAKQATQEDGK